MAKKSAASTKRRSAPSQDKAATKTKRAHATPVLRGADTADIVRLGRARAFVTERRRYPRSQHRLKARLLRTNEEGTVTEFSAFVKTLDLSIGGAFFQSSFLLKIGTELTIELDMPALGMTMGAKGTIVNAADEAQLGAERRGFALRFDSFVGQSQAALRAFLAMDEMRGFVEDFVEASPRLGDPDVARLVDMIVRWELHRDSLPG